MKNKIAVVVSLILLSAIIIFSCSKNSSSSMSNNTPPAPNTVSIANMAFMPATITVSHGTKITWTNNDNMTHTVTADDDSFDSGNIAPGSSFSRTFAVAGTYPYHCTIHPNMLGKVVVQ
jgi:plastocyanin